MVIIAALILNPRAERRRQLQTLQAESEGMQLEEGSCPAGATEEAHPDVPVESTEVKVPSMSGISPEDSGLQEEAPAPMRAIAANREDADGLGEKSEQQ